MNSLRTRIVAAVRGLARKAGGSLLSSRALDQLLSQRDRAIAELVVREGEGLKPGLMGVVFSKDRALQLYALLYTYLELVENPVPLVIVYCASTAAHEKAYAEVRASCRIASFEVTFVREELNFRATLLNVLAQITTSNLFFLVDDIIFIRPLDLGAIQKIDTTRTIVSFRHSPQLRRSYTAGVLQSPPQFRTSDISAELLEFDWFERANEWSNPLSVDGHVLSTAELRVLTRVSEFKAPNSYEGALATFNDLVRMRAGACFHESKILNLPINRVQGELFNRSGTISPEFLLDHWNNGMMLDTRPFKTHIPLAPHEEHSIEFTQRSPLPGHGDRLRA